MRHLIFICIMPLFIGCDPNVEMENIAPEKLLAVSSFISPQDTVFKVFLFRGSPLGSTVKIDSAAVKDALVTISDGTRYDTLLLTYEDHPVTGRKTYRYSARKKNVIVTTSRSYFLYVRTPSGERVYAECTIPPEPGQPEISGEQEENDYRFFVNWTNEALYKYFILSLDAEGQFEYVTPTGTYRNSLHASLSEPIQFPSDEQVLHNQYQAIVGNAFLAENPALKVSVRNIEENIFRYFEGYNRYEEWHANNSGTIFPNFQEMPLIFSNVQGGVGIFGGYNERSVEVEW